MQIKDALLIGVKVDRDAAGANWLDKINSRAAACNEAGAQDIAILLPRQGHIRAIVAPEFVEAEDGQLPYTLAWSDIDIGVGTIGASRVILRLRGWRII